MLTHHEETLPMSKRNIDAIKAGLWTSFFVFVTGVSASLIGWLNDLIAWAEANGNVPFPDPSVLKGAAVSAGAAAAIGIVNAIVRLVQANSALPGEPPAY